MKSVHHIALNCRDRNKQEEFYTKHFGFVRTHAFNSGTPEEFVILKLGGVLLELFPPPSPQDEMASEQAVGFKHLGLEVDDIEAKVNELNNDGIETGEIIDCAAYIEGLRVCFFKDPEGNTLELMENWPED